MVQFCLKSLHSGTLPQLFRRVFRVLEHAWIHRRAAWSRTATLFGLYIALSAITRALFTGNQILNVDESSYMVGAWELLRGNLPYAGFADNKPPLIYVYY